MHLEDVPMPHVNDIPNGKGVLVKAQGASRETRITGMRSVLSSVNPLLVAEIGDSHRP